MMKRWLPESGSAAAIPDTPSGGGKGVLKLARFELDNAEARLQQVGEGMANVPCIGRIIVRRACR
jgi:hypothetical protein